MRDAFFKFYLDDHFSRLEAQMSEIGDLINSAKAEALDAIARVQDDVNSLNAKITDLQARVDAGTATEAEKATLREVIAVMKGLDPVSPDSVPAAAIQEAGGSGGTPPVVA